VASTLAPTITPDTVISFDLNPGTLLQFLESRAEGGPRLKYFEGSVTLVTPGMSHETKGSRLDRLIFAVCLELRIKFTSLESTTWTLPFGAGDTGYEADKAYYVQSYGTTKKHHPPDLAWKWWFPTRRRKPCGPERS
jgi:Uma2 family endonuclease